MTGTKLASKSAVREESMIRPIIHRQLTRGDLACLVDEIARMDVSEGRDADQALQAGAVDTVLDSPAALEAVLGRGGAPAPLPLTLLWYIPIRAQLRNRGVTDILLADYAATLPVVFARRGRTLRARGRSPHRAARRPGRGSGRLYRRGPAQQRKPPQQVLEAARGKLTSPLPARHCFLELLRPLRQIDRSD